MSNQVKLLNFIKKLTTEIDNDEKNRTYILLTLNEASDVNNLSNLLQKKFALKYILDMFNKDKAYKDKKDNYWSLCITGFKYGAEKNSPRKIGLLAYKYGQTFNFKSAIFYNSETFSKYYTMNNVTYSYNDIRIGDYISNIILLSSFNVNKI